MAACIDTSRTTEPSQISQRPNRSQPDENHYKFANFCRPTFPDHVSTIPFNKNHTKNIHTRKLVDFSFEEEEEADAFWLNMKEEARASEVFAVDIHPGAKIGSGILFDHATGVVVGETAVIGNNVSILHNVTLGGTGKASGDRHPKIGNGVLIGAGTCILGNIKIGDGAKIGAGSVVLKEVPPRTTAVGNPARLVGGRDNPVKLDKIPSFTMDHTSHISEWSDYVI
ncbi:hypothetical protein CCACVL1_11257 [Corchorus capsularis]|uniref:serine O-acetyltransferase n=1 Tax=Corchorus capsularis TaxID=210143 RepID=A0A1R3IMC4_COCAP|nr:hypothetical protein CCACVL1_11257 [Corchorus capsularis]